MLNLFEKWSLAILSHRAGTQAYNLVMICSRSIGGKRWCCGIRQWSHIPAVFTDIILPNQMGIRTWCPQEDGDGRYRTAAQA